MLPPERLLLESMHYALEAVQAQTVLPRHLSELPQGALRVIGAGKAAAAMAATVESHFPDNVDLSGLVLTRYGHALATRRIQVIEAGHPLPDNQGERAARRILQLIRHASPDDDLLVLLSGGASSLLSLPEPGLELGDILAVTREMLRSGAPIEAINCVRKHLSGTLGGKLAAACAAPSRVLIISDVVGDDTSVIASGPFAPDPSTYEEALQTLEFWKVPVPERIHRFLTGGMHGRFPETIKPGSDCFNRVDTRIIANAETLVADAQAFFRKHAIATCIIDLEVTGEARKVAADHAARVRAHIASDLPRPMALISAGETRVKVCGHGRGGRNSEYLLALAHHLNGLPGAYALAIDTDGIDGTEDNAGALLTPALWQKAASLGLNVADHLERNDAYGYFSALDALVVTGPTRTNVNDYRVILIT